MEITIINHALKEWAVAVEALEAGKTILLLRKGGIKEEGNHFKVAHNEVLLYPTFEHQKPDLLKPEYADQVTPVPSGWHPETIRIGAWANVTDILLVSFEPSIKALLPFHVWNEKFVSDRLKWKPRQPIYVLLLRTYKLSEPKEIPYLAEYGGCKSWITLQESISVANATPVLTDTEYNKRTSVIRNFIANPSAYSILSQPNH